jgi:hypothetical protein
VKLEERLAQLEPKEADLKILGIWKGFVESPQYEALELTVYQMKAAAEHALLHPEATNRSFSAGQLSALKQLMTFITSASEFDPEKAQYGDPGEDPDTGAVGPEADVQY